MQAGSSVMPGKVNPAIPEAVAQAAMQTIANDQLLTQACMNGNLELNQFMPAIADALLGSIGLLTSGASNLAAKCVCGITANREKHREQMLNSTAVITALLPRFGYEKCSEFIHQAQQQKMSIRDFLLTGNIISDSDLEDFISPESVNRLGF